MLSRKASHVIDTRHAAVADIARFARGAKFVVLVLALMAYGLAYYVWTLGQWAGAAVLAIFGYVVLRSRAQLCYNLTRRRFRGQPEVASVLALLDADTLARGESTMRRRLRSGDVED